MPAPLNRQEPRAPLLVACTLRLGEVGEGCEKSRRVSDVRGAVLALVTRSRRSAEQSSAATNGRHLDQARRAFEGKS